jgi:uncharacterized protein DUF4390
MMWRAKLQFIILISLLSAMLLPLAAHAEGNIQIKSVSLAAAADGYEISVDSEIVLNATLERALEKGIVLYFVTKFTLLDPRWYWFDKEVARTKPRVGLTYYALTRRYRLNYRSHSRDFYSLKEALQVLSQLRDHPITINSELKPGVEYKAALRVWLDLTRMPKPFQVEALSSSGWNLSSDTLEWHMTLPLSTQPFHLKGD